MLTARPFDKTSLDAIYLDRSELEDAYGGDGMAVLDCKGRVHLNQVFLCLEQDSETHLPGKQVGFGLFRVFIQLCIPCPPGRFPPASFAGLTFHCVFCFALNCCPDYRFRCEIYVVYRPSHA